MLTNVRWADWNSSGGLAVVHDVEGHSRLEYPIGNVLYQTTGWISNIRFSPKGDKIAFMNHPGLWNTRGTVCVIDLTGKVQLLTQEWSSEQGLAWHDKEVWFAASTEGTTQDLMALSPAGKVRNLLDLPMAITLHDVATDGRVLIALNSMRLALGFGTVGSQNDVDLSWHNWNVAKDIERDGKFVLFEDSSATAGPGFAVVLRKLDGTLPIRLGEGSAGGLSADGKWAIAISNNHPQQVTLLPVGAGQPKPVEIGGLEHIQPGWARFLADGQRLILNGNELSHTSRCYILNLSGAKPKPVTPEGTLCGPPSSDSRFVIGVRPNSAATIYPLADGPTRSIPGLEATFQPVQWANDGSAIYGYHVGELPSKIYKVEIATGRQTVVQALRPGVPAGVVNVSPIVVSRDGKRFAYSYNQTLSVLYVVSGLQ